MWDSSRLAPRVLSQTQSHLIKDLADPLKGTCYNNAKSCLHNTASRQIRLLQGAADVKLTQFVRFEAVRVLRRLTVAATRMHSVAKLAFNNRPLCA